MGQIETEVSDPELDSVISDKLSVLFNVKNHDINRLESAFYNFITTPYYYWLETHNSIKVLTLRNYQSHQKILISVECFPADLLIPWQSKTISMNTQLEIQTNPQPSPLILQIKTYCPHHQYSVRAVNNFSRRFSPYSNLNRCKFT